MADPTPVDPNVNPQAGAGEVLATPLTDFQLAGNTDGYGSPNEPEVPASEVRFSAADLDALAAANGVSAGDTDIEVGITDAQLFAAEAEAQSQGRVSSQVRQTRNQPNNRGLAQFPVIEQLASFFIIEGWQIIEAYQQAYSDIIYFFEN